MNSDKKYWLLLAGLLSFPVGQACAEALLFEQAVTVTDGGGHNLRGNYDLLETTPDGKFLYALNAQAAGGLEVFEMETNDGELLFENDFPVASAAVIEGATAMAFNSGFVFLGNDGSAGSDGLSVFFRGFEDPATQAVLGAGFEAANFRLGAAGALEPSKFAGYSITDVTVSTDGKALHLVGNRESDGQGAVITLSNLTYLPAEEIVQYASEQILLETNDGIAGLAAPVAVAMASNTNSPDELYVISDLGIGSDALVQFTRNTDTGLLVHKSSTLNNNSNGITALDGPSDVLVLNSADDAFIYIAARDADAIVQFNRFGADGVPSLKKVYAETDQNIEGLNGVSKLFWSSTSGVLYAAATPDSRISSFYADEGDLLQIQASTVIAQGSSVSTGAGPISGLSGVDLFAVQGEREFLYAASSSSGAIVRFSRQSNLSLDVSALRSSAQPGQLISFRVTLVNNGPADAPGVLMTLSTSHPIYSISSGSADCTTTTENNSPSTLCEMTILDTGGEEIITVTLNPRSVSTARVSAQVISRNELPGTDSVRRADDSVKVGDFRSGTLSFDLWFISALLLTLALWQSRRGVSR